MSSVADNQTQIVLSRKVNTSFDVLLLRGEDNIVAHEPTSAGHGRVFGQWAGVIGHEGPELCDRVISPAGRQLLEPPRR